MRVFGTDYPTPDGTCIRDYIHVSDLANAHVAALEYLRAGGTSDIFNCGYGCGSYVLEVIRQVEDVSNVTLTIKLEDRRRGDAPSIVASNDKIVNGLGWRPKLDDLRTIVTHALSWEERLVRAQAA